MKRALAAAWLLSLFTTGCVPILIHAQIQAEAAEKVEWERQNFEREKAGMPLLTFKEWRERMKPPPKPPTPGVYDPPA